MKERLFLALVLLMTISACTSDSMDTNQSGYDVPGENHIPNTGGYTGPDIPDFKTDAMFARIDQDDPDNGSNQFSFALQSGTTLGEYIDMTLSGIFFNGQFKGDLDADLIELGDVSWGSVTECPSEGYYRLKNEKDGFGEPIRPTTGNMYCIKLKDGNYGKFRVTDVAEYEAAIGIEYTWQPDGSTKMPIDSTAPKFVSVSVTDGQTVDPEEPIFYEFSEPIEIEPETFNYENVRIIDKNSEMSFYGTPRVSGEYGTNYLIVEPYGMEEGGEYEIVVSGTITDLTGNPIEINHTLTVRT